MRRIITICLTVWLLSACSDDLTLPLPNEPTIEKDDVLAPCNMTRAEALELMLSHGVGYGYNGVEGEMCNVPDVRSQVLDPNALREAGFQVDLNKISDNQFVFNSKTAFSLNELLEKVYFGGGASAEAVVVFKGSIRGTLQLYSQKKIHSYYCKAYAYKNGFYSDLDGLSVATVVTDSDSIAKYPNILTKNFRSAIARLGKNPTKIQMDSLIARYGTHVVTKCTLGGMIELDIRLEKDSIANIHQQNAIGEVALLSLYNHQNQSSDDEYDLKIVSSGDSRLMVRGGESRNLERTLMNFNWGRDAVRSEDIDEWLNSIGTDEDKRQSLEMTSMDMLPIWEFIPDPDVAKKLRAHITGNADLLLELYGYQNFVNTSFDANILETGEEWTLYADNGSVLQTSTKCENYNIEAGGRYVATLCREIIPEINISKPVWVAYPIYQQEVNIATGLCIDEGKAYRVGWQFGQIVVSPIPASNLDGRIYMTGGYLYPKPTEGINYQESHMSPGYEWPGSINTDGTLDKGKAIYLPYKQDDMFLLRNMNGSEQQGSLAALPNWTYDKKKKRMVRDNSYNYYYSGQEVAYAKKYINDVLHAKNDIHVSQNAHFIGTTSCKINVDPAIDLTLNNAIVNNNIVVGGNVGELNRWARLWLDGATVNGQIDCRYNTVIELCGSSKNIVIADSVGKAAIHSTGGLDIQGKGALEARGAAGGAGIGSNANETYNTINANSICIYSGNTTAYGGTGAAGIGLGSGSSIGGIGTRIVIEGGNVTAYGGKGAAGIGSGDNGSTLYRIDIEGGEIHAYGGDGGAGIGCGTDGGSLKFAAGQSSLLIDGGNVFAQGGRGAAGVGSGAGNSYCRDITISDGSVKAIGGDGGAGIGSGIDGSNCDEIATRGCTITAEGGKNGAGIGSGKGGKCTDITCRSNTVIATGGIAAPGIGSGAEGGTCRDIAIKSATVTAKGGSKAAAIGSGKNKSSCRDIDIKLYLLWSDPPVVTVIKGPDTPNAIGAGENSTCGKVSIHEKAKITIEEESSLSE